MIKRFNLSLKLEICFLFCFFLLCELYSSSDTSSTARNDTIIYHSPIKLLGALFTEQCQLPKHNLPIGDNVSAFEFIERKSNLKFLTLGAIGNTPYMIEYGLVTRPSIYSNGLKHQQLPVQSSSFEFFPLLAFESIEIFKGSEAVVRGRNSNGVLFNFTPRILNTKYPYTQIWIGQAGYEYLGSSGLFSQNFLPNMNFFFLYQRYWSAGRYTNSNADRWNLLAGVRWNLTQNFNLLFQNQYTILNNGLYGGLNPEKSISLFDNAFSTPNFESLNTLVKQNDFSANYFYLFSPDSSASISGGLLFSYATNDVEMDKFLTKSGEEFEKSNAILVYFNSKLLLKSKKFDLLIGTEIEKNWLEQSFFSPKNEELIPSVFAASYARLNNKTKLTIVGRIDKFSQSLSYTTGTKLLFFIDSISNLYFDISFKSTGKSESYRDGFLAILGNEFQWARFQLAAEVFGRFLRDYSIYTAIHDNEKNILGAAKILTQNINFLGANVLISFPLIFGSQFYTKLNLNYAISNGKAKEWLPFLFSKSGISYKYSRGVSYLEIGIEFELLSQFKGLYILPFFVYPVEYYKEPTGWQNNGLNLYASAKLGNAFLNFSFRNIFSTNFYYLPIYPEYDRSIRITLFWSFND